jgi:multicomponent Na+:H+ antiporter subunit D
MAVASTYLIWAMRTEKKRAGMRYIVVHIVGGSLALAGVILHSRIPVQYLLPG